MAKPQKRRAARRSQKPNSERKQTDSPGDAALGFNNRAIAKAVAGDTAQARELFQHAVSIDGRCRVARENLTALDARHEKSSRLHSGAMGITDPGRKIAIVSLLFNWPTGGGGNVHTVELACHLKAAGHSVRHFYASRPDWGVGRVANCPFPSEGLEFADGEWNAGAIQRRFRSAVQEFRPDAVLVTDAWNFKPLLAEAVSDFPFWLRFDALECLCPLNNIRLLPLRDPVQAQCGKHQLGTPQACLECVERNYGSSGSLHQRERALSWQNNAHYHERLLNVLQQAEAALVVNPLIKALLEPYTRRVEVITGGIDLGRFPAPESSKSHGLRRVLFPGNAGDALKGFAVLREACDRLWQVRQDFEVVATGLSNEGQPAFVRALDWQPHEKVPELLASADIIALPSICQDAMPLAALEAMAAARPIIATRIGGLQFSVVDGLTGLLFELGNAADLAAKIARLLDDSSLRRTLGAAGRQCVEEHFAWPGIIERHYAPLLRALPATRGA